MVPRVISGLDDPRGATATRPTGAPPASEFGAAHHRPGRPGGWDLDDEPDLAWADRFTEAGWPAG